MSGRLDTFKFGFLSKKPIYVIGSIKSVFFYGENFGYELQALSSVMLFNLFFRKSKKE